MGNRSARACKEVSPFIGATIHLSSSFDKHALVLSTAACSCKGQHRLLEAALPEQRAQVLALPQVREKRNDGIFHCIQHLMILQGFE